MNPKEKLLETEFVKQQQWQSRLEELKNEIKQMQSSLEKISYKLRNNYDVEE